MQPLIDLIFAVALGVASVWSFRDHTESERTGRARLFFWDVFGHSYRDENHSFFRLQQRMHSFRTFFLFLASLIAVAAFLQDIAIIIGHAITGK